MWVKKKENKKEERLEYSTISSRLESQKPNNKLKHKSFKEGHT